MGFVDGLISIGLDSGVTAAIADGDTLISKDYMVEHDAHVILW